MLIDGIPGIHKSFHAPTWATNYRLAWDHGLSNLVAFCRLIDMRINCIWYHGTSPLYAVEVFDNDVTSKTGSYNTTDIVLDHVDLMHCAPIIRVLPCIFEAEAHVKVEGAQ